MRDDITEAELEAQEIDIDHADQQVVSFHALELRQAVWLAHVLGQWISTAASWV